MCRWIEWEVSLYWDALHDIAFLNTFRICEKMFAIFSSGNQNPLQFTCHSVHTTEGINLKSITKVLLNRSFNPFAQRRRMKIGTPTATCVRRYQLAAVLVIHYFQTAAAKRLGMNIVSFVVTSFFWCLQQQQSSEVVYSMISIWKRKKKRALTGFSFDFDLRLCRHNHKY